LTRGEHFLSRHAAVHQPDAARLAVLPLDAIEKRPRPAWSTRRWRFSFSPSFARGRFRSGLIRIYAGQHDLAIEHLETSMRLSPRERIGTPVQWIGMAHFFKRRFEVAELKMPSIARGTDGSNPSPSSAESIANLQPEP